MALEYYETVGLARIDLSKSAEAQKGIAQRGAGPCHVAVRKIIAGTPVGSFVPMSAALMKVREMGRCRGCVVFLAFPDERVAKYLLFVLLR